MTKISKKNLRVGYYSLIKYRGGVEDKRLEAKAKAKDTKKSEAKAKAKDSLSEDRHSRGQGQECSRPRTGMLEAKAKDQGLDLRGQGQGLQNVSSRTSSRPRTSSRTPPLIKY